MKDHLSIGPAPAEETPVQLGEADYARRAKLECNKFIEAIRKKLGREPDGARLGVKQCPQDFGSYYDVVCYFDSDDVSGYNYALRCESDAPTTWEEVGMRAPRNQLRAR